MAMTHRLTRPERRMAIWMLNVWKIEIRILDQISFAQIFMSKSGLGVLVDVDCRPALVGGVADVFERALDATRLPRDADAASVPDQLVGEVDPLLARDDLHQILLDLLDRKSVV